MLRFLPRRGHGLAPLLFLSLLLLAPALVAAVANLGSEVPLGDASLHPAPFNQSVQALASNGIDYLAVWTDERSASLGANPSRALFAGRVDAEGRPTEPFGHQIGEGSVVALTWTGTSYFVLYMGSGLGGGFRGQHLDADGKPLDATVLFDLSGPPRELATNGRNFLVVQYGGVASVLGAGGNVIWKEQLASPIASSRIVVLPGGDYRFASVSSSQVQLVTVNGTSGMMTVTALPLGNATAAGVATDDSGRYLIAWLEGGAAKTEIVAANGQIVAGPATLGSTDASEVAAAWDGSELLVVLRSATAEQATRISAAGQPIATTSLGGTASLPRFARSTTGVAMAWDAGSNYDIDVWDRAALNFAALLGAPVHALAQTPALQRAPHLAGTFAVWQEGVDPVSLVEQAPGHAPVTLGQLSTFSRPAVVARGAASYLVVWIDNLFEAGSRMVAKRVALDGTPIDAQPFVIVAPPDTPDSLLVQPQIAAVAFDGTRFLVVWTNQSGDLRAVHVSQDGQVLDAQPIAIWDRGMRSSDTSLVRVVWSGTHYVLAWVEQAYYLGGISPPPPMAGTVYLASLNADGSIATAPQAVWTNYAVNSLALAATGSNVALLWPGTTLRNTGEICLDALPLKNDATPLAALSELRCTARRLGDPSPYTDVGLAWNGGELVSAFTDAQSTIAAWRLDALLAPIDAAPFAVSPAGLTAAQPDVSAIGNGVAIAYTRLAPESGNVQRAFERTLLRLNAPPRRHATK